MSPEALASFIDYTVPEYNFSVGNGLYNFQPVQQSFVAAPLVYTPPVVAAQPVIAPVYTPVAVQPVVTGKTIAFTVYDANGTLPGANIAIDGIGKAQTNGNGSVTIPNVLPTSLVKISYIGYEDYTVIASSLPSKVTLTATALQLSEITIPAWKKPTSNTWAWLLVGVVGAFGIYKYSTSGTKVVKAKI